MTTAVNTTCNAHHSVKKLIPPLKNSNHDRNTELNSVTPLCVTPLCISITESYYCSPNRIK